MDILKVYPSCCVTTLTDNDIRLSLQDRGSFHLLTPHMRFVMIMLHDCGFSYSLQSRFLDNRMRKISKVSMDIHAQCT